MAPKGKKKGKNKAEDSQASTKIRIANKENGEVYGVVLQMLGNSRMKVYCFDGKIRIARIRGKLVKRMWIREEDVVIVSPWDFQDDRADIVYRYTRSQVSWLQKRGYIPENYMEQIMEKI
ncbi:MAG: translation initiation factor eIF-1A [Candidatus Helarchaeota archaeon]